MALALSSSAEVLRLLTVLPPRRVASPSRTQIPSRSTLRTTAVISFLTIDKTQVCAAGTSPMAKPSDFTSKTVSCANVPDPDPQPVKDIAPGDKCSVDNKDKCFGGADCPSDGVCVAAAESGDSCKSGDNPSDKMCAVGQFCDVATSQEDPKCAAIKNIGDECTIDAQCGYMAYCVKVADDANKQCTAFGSVDNGKELDVAQPFVCKSWNVYTNENKFYCMQGDTSETDPSTSSVALSTECKFNTFTDPANPGTGAAGGNNPALCGFNKDDQAWCPLLKGDPPLTTPLGKYQTLISGLRDKCNILSAGVGICNNAATSDDVTIATDFAQAQSLLISVNPVTGDKNGQGWPNVAANADCTKSTYTLYFYGGNAVAMTAAAVGALAMLF